MNKLGSTHVYQAFFFDNRVKEHFYAGNAFMGYREDLSVEELMGLAGEIMEGFVYDFWEFGPDCFSLYWWIRKEVYHEKLTLIRQWAEYKGISDWMEINEVLE